MNGPYEAIGMVIRKKPIHTKTENGNSLEIGFPVCEVTEYLDENGAKAVAVLMNQGDVFNELLNAANNTVEGLAEEYFINSDHDDEWICDTLGSVLAGVYFSARSAIVCAQGRSYELDADKA